MASFKNKKLRKIIIYQDLKTLKEEVENNNIDIKNENIVDITSLILNLTGIKYNLDKYKNIDTKINLEFFEYILKSGIDVNEKSNEKTALSCIIKDINNTFNAEYLGYVETSKNELYDMLYLLIKYGANPNSIVDEENNISILEAIEYDKNLFKLLVENGADINKINNNVLDDEFYDKTFLSRALMNYFSSRDTEIIEFLLKHNTIIDENSKILLFLNFKYSYKTKSIIKIAKNDIKKILTSNLLLIDKIKKIEENLKIIEENRDDKIIFCIDYNLLNLFKNYKNFNFNFSVNGISIYDLAVEANDIEMLDYLINSGINPNKYIDISYNEKYTIQNKENQNSDLIKSIKNRDIDLFIENITPELAKKIPITDLIKEKFPIKFVEICLENKSDINFQDINGDTALMLACRNNDMELIDLLLKYNPNMDLQNQSFNKVFAYVNKTNINLMKKLITYYQDMKNNNNPQFLVELLKNFTIDTPIKCTTHSWEGTCENSKNIKFDEFMVNVKNQWDTIKEDLNKLSPNLYQKIENFIFSKEKKEWCKETKLDIGWQNVIGKNDISLKEWCDSDIGNTPFNFELKEQIEYKNNKTITIFEEIIQLFKRKIEVRNEQNMLKEICLEFRKLLKSNNIKLKLNKSLEGIDFYTDVEKFKSALKIIFDIIITQTDEKGEVEILVQKPETNFIEIHLIHKNSFSNKDKETMLKEIEDGDFREIKENLQNLCDWSIVDVYNEKSFKVNYLKSSNIPSIEDIEKNPDGFTHILKFYK